MARRSIKNVFWRGEVNGKGGTAYLEIVINGKKHRESLHTGNWDEADKRRDQRVAELRAGANASPDSAAWHTPGEAPRKYAETREYAEMLAAKAKVRGSSDYTIKQGLRLQWKRLCAEFPTVDAITDATIEAYFYRRLSEGSRYNSVKRDIAPLKKCVNEWGRKFHPELPVLMWEMPRKVRGQTKSAQAGEPKPVAFLRKWLAELHDRAKAQALVALCTGLRAEELRRVKPGWVLRISDDRIQHILKMPVGSTKSGHPRTIGLPAPIARLIAEHFPIAEDYKKHFCGVARRLDHNDTVTLRDLRHTFKVEMSRKDALATNLVMGHRHLEGTSGDIYQHLVLEDCIRIAVFAQSVFLGPQALQTSASRRAPSA